MSFLMYCIFETSASRPRREQSGVGGRPVAVIGEGGLSAAVSPARASDRTPDIPRVLAYQRVIEAFSRDQAVIPMRYGALFPEQTQVLRLLREQRESYGDLLDKLGDCVEMGIRLLLNGEQRGKSGKEPGTGPPIVCAEPEAENRKPRAGRPQSLSQGRAFLSERRAHYGREEKALNESERFGEEISASLSGLFREKKIEHSSPEILSLHFLVPRTSVESFRQTFAGSVLPAFPRTLISGPWPAYNFVRTSEPLLPQLMSM